MLGTILVHIQVNGFAQGQSTTKVLRIGYFPNINHAQAVIGFCLCGSYERSPITPICHKIKCDDVSNFLLLTRKSVASKLWHPILPGSIPPSQGLQISNPQPKSQEALWLQNLQHELV
jgi:hypothetical protein